MDIARILNINTDWTGAKCINRPAEFCPGEDIMTTSEWAKGTAPARAKECISCPLFDKCETLLMDQLEDEDLSPTGIMAGVVLVQKSPAQILKALAKVKNIRTPHPTPTKS